MNKILVILLLLVTAYFSLGTVYSEQSQDAAVAISKDAPQLSSKIPNLPDRSSTAVFAGGCFWCVESDFEKLDGVSEAISGYTGGSASTADYKTVSYTETGHYEAVQVVYDSAIVSYSDLVEFFWRTIDPTDPEGQFCDKGSSYRSAIFYGSDQEKQILEKSLAQLNDDKPFDGPIVTAIAPAQPFYKAEQYHQSYYKKNPIRYKYYRNGCRRDQRLKQLWD
jgi:methionine-S-sulfoxide reductase